MQQKRFENFRSVYSRAALDDGEVIVGAARDEDGGKNRGEAHPRRSHSAWEPRPGWGSWLAFLYIGISAATWAQNEQLVIWLLSHEIVGESAIRSLSGALRWASVAAGALAMLAAWRVLIWSALLVINWRPLVRTLTAYLGGIRGPLVDSRWGRATAAIITVRSALASALARLQHGAVATARSISLAMQRV